MDDPKNLHLAFTAKTLDYVLNVLAQRPFAEVAGLVADIHAQVHAQQLAQAPTTIEQE